MASSLYGQKSLELQDHITSVCGSWLNGLGKHHLLHFLCPSQMIFGILLFGGTRAGRASLGGGRSLHFCHKAPSDSQIGNDRAKFGRRVFSYEICLGSGGLVGCCCGAGFYAAMVNDCQRKNRCAFIYKGCPAGTSPAAIKADGQRDYRPRVLVQQEDQQLDLVLR